MDEYQGARGIFQAAVSMNEMYISFIEAGFTSEQAFELVRTAWAEIAKNNRNES